MLLQLQYASKKIYVRDITTQHFWGDCIKPPSDRDILQMRKERVTEERYRKKL